MKISIKATSIIICCQFLQGCVGYIGPVHTMKTTISCEKNSRDCWGVIKNSITCDKSNSDCLKDINDSLHNDVVPNTPSKKIVLLKVGRPQSIKKSEDGEIWDYRHDVAWRGIVPVFVIPIPLMLPVGFNHWQYNFTNDNLLSISREEDYAIPCIFFIYCQR